MKKTGKFITFIKDYKSIVFMTTLLVVISIILFFIWMNRPRLRYKTIGEGEYEHVIIYGYIGQLTNVIINSSYNGKPVKEIGAQAFENCKTLISITIPETIEEISSRAFKDCIKLESISFPNKKILFGQEIFYGCIGLKHIEFPDDIDSLNSTFIYCTNLKSVALPKHLIELNWGTFSGCKSLSEVIIPDGVTSIGNYVFTNCVNLKSIVIPSSVIRIVNNSFNDCDQLSSVYYKGTEEQWNAIIMENGVNSNLSQASLYYNYQIPT